jgi:hypothetical protein
MLIAMTLLDAKQYDAGRDRRRRNVILFVVIVVLVLAWVGYHLRNHLERADVSHFFAALQRQDYETAYGIWFHDRNWRQHPQKYKYEFNEFYQDWGPGGEWGLIKSYHVDCSLSPSNGSGVIVQATVNGRAEHPYLWVQKSDKTLSFSPSEIECGNWWAWVVE